MDLSDGLADGIQQLADASGTGDDRRGIAPDPGCRARMVRARGTAIRLRPRAGGDDYELLFAVPPPSPRPAGDGAAPVAGRGDDPYRRAHQRTVPCDCNVTSRSSRCPPDSSTSDPMLNSPDVRRWLDQLLHTHDTPQRTAAAYALGVFFGFSPLLGLHTVLGLVCAFALNLNRVAVLLGIYSNLPWILPAYYTLATMVGAAILRVEVPPGLLRDLSSALADASWADFRQTRPRPDAAGLGLRSGLDARGARPRADRLPGRARHGHGPPPPPRTSAKSR